MLLGGLLTSRFDWHWIFLVNLPIGVAVYAAARTHSLAAVLLRDPRSCREPLDAKTA